MPSPNQEKKVLEELSELYLFAEIYRFFRESTGLAIASAYIILILSSMAYLFVLYDKFNISIVKYISFEDILATPLKNPNIILTFLVALFILYVADVGNRYRARTKLKYGDGKKPIYVTVLQNVFWSPNQRKANIRTTAVVVLMCFVIYIFVFASFEAAEIKRGKGDHVIVSLADGDTQIKTTLLGTTSNYIFTHDHLTDASSVYYVESVKSMTPILGIAPSTQFQEKQPKTKQSE